MKLSVPISKETWIQKLSTNVVRKKRLFWPDKSHINDIILKVRKLNISEFSNTFEQLLTDYCQKYENAWMSNWSLSIVIERMRPGQCSMHCTLIYSQREYGWSKMQSVERSIDAKLGKTLLFLQDWPPNAPRQQYVKYIEVVTRNVHWILWLQMFSKQYLWRHSGCPIEVNIYTPDNTGGMPHETEYHHLQYR